MSGDRLSGVNISVWPIQMDSKTNLQTSKTTKTTKNGQYNLALEPGKYRAMIIADGYDPMSSTFTVSFLLIISFIILFKKFKYIFNLGFTWNANRQKFCSSSTIYNEF